MSHRETAVIRLCVILSFILYSVYFLMPFVYPYFYSEEVIGYIFYSPVKPIFSTTNNIAWVLFVFHAIATIWIYKRISTGRYIYLIVVVLDVLVATASGFLVHTPIDTPLIALINMLDAVVIYIAFIQISDPYQQLHTN